MFIRSQDNILWNLDQAHGIKTDTNGNVQLIFLHQNSCITIGKYISKERADQVVNMIFPATDRYYVFQMPEN